MLTSFPVPPSPESSIDSFSRVESVVHTTLFRCTQLKMRGALLESRFYDQRKGGNVPLRRCRQAGRSNPGSWARIWPATHVGTHSLTEYYWTYHNICVQRFWLYSVLKSVAQGLYSFDVVRQRHIHYSNIPDRLIVNTPWTGTKRYYSTGVQIVSCTLSDDSVLSESTGLFNPVLCVSQWNLCWQKKSANEIVSFKSVLAWKRMIPLSTWWLQQAFWRPNWIIIPNMTLKYVLFL